MTRSRYEAFTARYVVLPNENVDTDQIIPARYLATTDRAALGALAFHAWRYRDDGTPDPAFVLNRPEAAGAGILVAGRNFGCGSAREQAVWALAGAGFRAIVSVGFADTFRANALANGLLPIEVGPDVRDRIVAGARSDARAQLAVDLDTQTLTLPDGTEVGFEIEPFAKHCLREGVDELELLFGLDCEIDEREARHPPRPTTPAPELSR